MAAVVRAFPWSANTQYKQRAEFFCGRGPVGVTVVALAAFARRIDDVGVFGVFFPPFA